FSIQRLKTRPPLGGINETEVSAEDALRTALRLGDSVLIVGEVRSGEAKALYEAMRVGAVGNVVMGTIHGESAYGIWDRVVNDLGVPTTSFKATDFAIVSAPIRFKGSLKRQRRVIEVTEVEKEWTEDPLKENGFLQWMEFDANKDSLDLYEESLKKSPWLRKVQRNRGLSFEQMWAEIVARGAEKQFMVDTRRALNLPVLLEADNTVRAHTKYLVMQEKQREEIGSADHKLLLEDWKKWVTETLAKDIIRDQQSRQKSSV
ncbi:secretion system protein, partial [Candidatus Micrarchaeota archaeon CG10_big_fil_rev_8_21_14_0_10_59_7]